MDEEATPPPRFSTDLWDCFDLVAKKIENEINSCREIGSIIRKKAQVELEYSRKLQKIAESCKNVKLRGSMDSAWTSISRAFAEEARAHAKAGETLESTVAQAIDSFTKDQDARRKATAHEGSNLLKEQKTTLENLQKTKAAFEKAEAEAEEINRELQASMGKKNQAKVETKQKKATEKASAAQDAYSRAIEAAKGVQDRFHSTAMPAVLDELQNIDTILMHLLKANMAKIVQFTSDKLPRIQEALDESRELTSAIDNEGDLEAYITNYATGKEPPGPDEYMYYESRAGQDPCMLPADEREALPRDAEEKSGWVEKKSAGVRNIWRKRYAVLRKGHFRLYHSEHDTEPSTDLEVLIANVKPVPTPTGRPYCFQIIAVDRKYLMSAPSQQDADEWLMCIQNATASALGGNMSANQSKGKKRNPLEEERIMASEIDLEGLWAVPGNSLCCDCYSENPEWASINLGILICIECSGHHRHLGTHLSKVRSFKLDDWDPEVLEYFKALGNAKANRIWEHNKALTATIKPTGVVDAHKRADFIKAKYVDCALFPPKKPQMQAANEELRALTEKGAPPDKIIEQVGRGGDPNLMSAAGDSPMHIAAASGNVLTMLALLMNGGDCNLMSRRGAPLHRAAENNHAEMAKLLLKNGADINIPNQDGCTPLDVAKGSGSTEVMGWLEKLGGKEAKPATRLDN